MVTELLKREIKLKYSEQLRDTDLSQDTLEVSDQFQIKAIKRMRMHWKCDIIMMFPINEQDSFIALLDILCDSDIIAIKLLYIRLLSGQDIDKHFPDFPGELLNYFII